MPDQSKYANRLAGKHVLIIGGSSGLGYGVAEACLELGSTVIISSSSPTTVSQTLSRLQTAYPSAASRVSGFPCQLADPATLESNLATLFAHIGAAIAPHKLDHVVFTAGDPLAPAPVSETTLASITQTFLVRVFAPLLLAKHVQTHVALSPDSSFTITSGAGGDKPVPGLSVGASAAASHRGMARGLAVDLKPLRVNVVAPGYVDTEMWNRMPAEQKEVLMEGIAKGSATGRVGRVEDVVWAYLGVMMDGNVTGSVVETNAGMLFM